MPEVPIFRKPNDQYKQVNKFAAKATAAKWVGSSRWPSTAVSTRPNNGTVILVKISGQASVQNFWCMVAELRCKRVGWHAHFDLVSRKLLVVNDIEVNFHKCCLT